eukprot:IDg23138t1
MGRTLYDYFMWMFPQHHLEVMMECTNVQLSKRCAHITSESELLRFIGVLVLLAKFELRFRRSMWVTNSRFKYIAAPNFDAIMPPINEHRAEFASSSDLICVDESMSR